MIYNSNNVAQSYDVFTAGDSVKSKIIYIRYADIKLQREASTSVQQ